MAKEPSRQPKTSGGLSSKAKLDMAVLKARLRTLPGGTPHSLFIGLTSRCDLRCLHCKYRAAGPHGGAKDMPASLITRLLTGAARAGIPRVVFFGGEPLLCSGLEAAVTAAARLGLFTELDTNGQRLSRGRAAALARAGLSATMISLHSASPSAHDALSGAGTFLRASGAIRASLDAGLITYVSSCILSAAMNGAGLGRLLAFARKAGAHGARLLAYSPPSGRTDLPARLARRLPLASPDGYARTCAASGTRGCAATRGTVLFVGPDGSVRSCPYSRASLGTAYAGLDRFLPAGAPGARLFPCQKPRRVC